MNIIYSKITILTGSIYNSFFPAPQIQPITTQIVKDKILQLQNQLLEKTTHKYEHITNLEEEMYKMLNEVRGQLSMNDAELEGYGAKHANLIRKARLVKGLELEGIEVPLPKVSHRNRARTFSSSMAATSLKLGRNSTPSILRIMIPLFSSEKMLKSFLKISKAKSLKYLRIQPISLQKKWLNGWKASMQGLYIMVRSSGAEDSHKSANAGGNVSRDYVEPTPKAYCMAARDVVCSYLDYPSLHNQLISGKNPFENKPKLSFTTQELIGEPVTTFEEAAKIDKNEIPISLALFTSEPLYVGNEKFRVMRISATYGHGEGVVEGLGINTDTVLILVSDANPEKIKIIYDNVDKPQRLAPVRNANGVISLEAVDNPPELRNKPALHKEMLARLYSWGVVNEKFFQNTPTDMELVVKGEVIYSVQSRPINREPLLPTYLDTRKIPNGVVTKSLQGEMLVPGQGSVVVVEPSRILFVPTLKEADRVYKKEKYDAVIVTKPEPANTHPIVNFSEQVVPCLYVKDADKMHTILQESSPGNPMVLCMQQATINLWDSSKGKIEDYTTKGFIVHPAKIVISFPTKISQQAYGKAAEAPQDIKDVLLAIRCATTQEAAKEAFATLQKHPIVTSLKERKIVHKEIVPQQVVDTYTVLDHLIEAVDEAFKEVKAVLEKPQEGPLKQLFNVKVLETLLLSPDQVSCISIDPYLNEAKDLIEYQAQFSHPVHFASIYLAGNAAFDDSSKIAWREFIIKLESKQPSEAQCERLKQYDAHFRRYGNAGNMVCLLFQRRRDRRGLKYPS